MRNAVRNMLLKCGWDVRRTASWGQEKLARQHDEELQKWRFLQTLAPQDVLDIGANTGQFARLVRELLPSARILSFEPLAECFKQLQSATAELAPMQAFPYALGSEDSATVMNKNAFSPSSSLLPMETLHQKELPATRETTAETIQVRRLDGLQESLKLRSPFFVKIDVQGYTEPVLLGGEKTVRRSHAVVAEVSLRPLYRGEATFDKVWQLLTSWGFAYRGNVDQWISRTDGRILQCDCLFENLALLRD